MYDIVGHVEQSQTMSLMVFGDVTGHIIITFIMFDIARHVMRLQAITFMIL